MFIQIMIYFKLTANITVVFGGNNNCCHQKKMLARPFVYPGGGNSSSCIVNLSSITSCHKYYMFCTLDVFPDDRKG